MPRYHETRKARIKTEGGTELAHCYWPARGDFVACSINQCVRPVAFLMDNPGKISIIVPPRRTRSTSESLNSTESRILL